MCGKFDYQVQESELNCRKRNSAARIPLISPDVRGQAELNAPAAVPHCGTVRLAAECTTVACTTHTANPQSQSSQATCRLASTA